MFIQTAYSSHKFCFICKAKNRLYKIQKECVAKAYTSYKILIKQHARCCFKHFDENWFLKKDEYHNIPTIYKKSIVSNNFVFLIKTVFLIILIISRG